MGERNCAYCKADCGRAGHNYPIDPSFECFVAMTNGDRLRAMTDEELAEAFAQQMVEFVYRVASNLGYDIGTEKQLLLEQNKADWLQWLQSPADGGK